MGQRGFAPIPTAILKLRGSPLANRNPREPQPERRCPPCPKWLGKAERQVWRQTAKELLKIGVLTVIDRNALARYCVLLVKWVKANEFIDKYGTTMPCKAVRPVRDANGNQVFEEYVKCFIPMPQVGQLNQWNDALLRLEREFGLTPSSRTRIQVDLPREEPNDKARFFKPKIA